MIIIEIANVEELVQQKLPLKPKWGAKVLGVVTDEEAQVEKAIIEQLISTFAENGVKAKVFSIAGPDMLGNGKLEIPVKVRSSTFMS